MTKKNKKGQLDKRMRRWQRIQRKYKQERQKEAQLDAYYEKLCRSSFGF